MNNIKTGTAKEIFELYQIRESRHNFVKVSDNTETFWCEKVALDYIIELDLDDSESLRKEYDKWCLANCAEMWLNKEAILEDLKKWLKPEYDAQTYLNACLENSEDYQEISHFHTKSKCPIIFYISDYEAFEQASKQIKLI